MSSSGPNERLRSALIARNLTINDAAAELGVNPKTVERWIAGERLPHQRNQRALAHLVDQPRSFLWPETRSTEQALAAASAELIDLYPRRSDVPADLWPALFERASNEIGILVYAATFLVENYSTHLSRLASKGAAGCRVRVLLGDPDSPAVRARGEEEDFGDGIESRARAAIRHYRPLVGRTGIEIRIHDTTLYNSIFRSDDELLVNTHAYGANAYGAPVMHLRQLKDDSLFTTYTASFEAVWDLARPLET